MFTPNDNTQAHQQRQQTIATQGIDTCRIMAFAASKESAITDIQITQHHAVTGDKKRQVK